MDKELLSAARDLASPSTFSQEAFVLFSHLLRRGTATLTQGTRLRPLARLPCRPGRRNEHTREAVCVGKMGISESTRDQREKDRPEIEEGG